MSRGPTTQLLVVETITGRVRWRLPYTDLSWSSPLNKIPSCQANVPIVDSLDAISDQQRAAGRTVDPRATLRAFLLGPWRYSLVPCYGSQALVGGPMLPNDDVVADRVTINAAGMERMLEKRVLNRTTGTGSWSDPTRDVAYYSTTVAGAIWKLVTEAASGRPSRQLPITCTSPPGVIGLEDFVWPSYELEKAWKAVEDLVAREDGPDVRLEPLLSEDDQGLKVTWDLQIGDPYLPLSATYGPDGPMPWTYPASVATVTRTVDPAGMASAYYAAGEGQDRDKTIARAASDAMVNLGFPDLEEVETSTSTAGGSNIESVQNHANALIGAHRYPTDTWKVEVPADWGPGIGSVRRGDAVRLEVRDKLYIDPGYHLRRITDVSGGTGRTAQLACDSDDGVEG